MENLLSFARTAAAGLSLGAACVKPPPPENPIPVVVVNIPSVEEMWAQEVQVISEETKGQVFEKCYMEEPHHQCAKDELEALFTLADQLHPDLRRDCTVDGIYNRQCLDRTFQNVFSGQMEYDRFMTIKANCRHLLQSCIQQKLAKLE